jgi:coiled-coil domain-containing protein 6
LENERRRHAAEVKILKDQYAAMQKQVEEEEEYITNKLLSRLESERKTLSHEVKIEHDLIARLASEKAKLLREKEQMENALEAESEYISNKLSKQVERLGSEKAKLQREKADLQRHVGDLGAAVLRLSHEKVALENALEAEEEAAVNRLQRQLQQVTTAYRHLEQRMEQCGISPRDGNGAGPMLDSTLEWVYGAGRSPSRRSQELLAAAPLGSVGERLTDSSKRERSLSIGQACLAKSA